MSSTARRQGVDYEEPANIDELTPAAVPDAKTVTIASGPISLKTLVFWGLVIFAAGFFHGRQMSHLGSRAAEPATREPAPAIQSVTSTAPAMPQPNTAPGPRVTIRMLKFSPEVIEVRTGEAVEWANSDLTPNTVTSQGSGDLNSGSIDAGASWRHTFGQPGSFPYFCTFHAEMKGSVVVK